MKESQLQNSAYLITLAEIPVDRAENFVFGR